MKVKNLFIFLFSCSLLAEVDLDNIKHTHSLVLIEEPTRASHQSHKHLKICPLDHLVFVTDKQIQFNKCPHDSRALDNEYVNMMKEDVEAVLEPFDVSVRMPLPDRPFGFQIKDASGVNYVVVFKNIVDENKTGTTYQAWILPNSTIDIFVGQMSDEAEKMGEAISQEVIELPNIPLPPCVTNALVKAGTYVLMVYFTVKENLQKFYNKVHEKFLKQHENEDQHEIKEQEEQREA